MTWRSIKDDPPPEGEMLLVTGMNGTGLVAAAFYCPEPITEEQEPGPGWLGMISCWPNAAWIAEPTHWWDFGDGKPMPEPPDA